MFELFLIALWFLELYDHIFFFSKLFSKSLKATNFYIFIIK